MQLIKRGVLLFLVIFSLAACDSLPKELREKAEKTPERIKLMKKEISEQEAKYKKMASIPDFSDFKVYADREKWADSYQKANDNLDRATVTFDQIIVPILKKNESAMADALRQQMERIDRIVIGAKEAAITPFTRRAFIEDARKKCKQWVETAESEVRQLSKLVGSLEGVVEKTKNDFPAKAEEVQNLFVPFRQKQEESQSALEIASQEMKKHKRDESGLFVDYALLGDNTVKISSMLGLARKEDEQLRNKLKELYQSYSKILADMRQDFYITVARESWDEDSDWETIHEYKYPPVKVEEDVFEYFQKLDPEKVVASHSQWFGYNEEILVDKTMWNALNVNFRQEWPSSWDDHAEYFIGEDEVKCYHKYIIVRNDGQKEETDWIEVDDDEYEETADDLGMEIESKPYGEFESDKHEEAAPPGMSFVGNSKYGEWQKDPADSGRTIWHWYGQYAFLRDMLGSSNSHYYDRDEWNRYREYKEKKQPYYGTYANSNGTASHSYGTMGAYTRSNSRFANSHFSRSGGFRSADAAVRGAGSAGRGGGPGGGGK